MTKTQLDADTIKAITNCIIDRLREEETTAREARYDKRLASTKLLLRNYRSLCDHCESAIYDASQVDDDMSIAEILELMTGNRSSGFRIESIRTSAVRTRIIIDHINTMLELYKTYCDASHKEEDARRYRVIYWLYLSDIPKSPGDLAEEEHVDKRTIFRDIEGAVERLTALLFGIDGLYSHVSAKR